MNTSAAMRYYNILTGRIACKNCQVPFVPRQPHHRLCSRCFNHIRLSHAVRAMRNG
jgi:hypothetical protein